MKIAFKIKAKNGILQRFIEEREWSQADFGRAIGAFPSDVGRWFNMKVAPGPKYMKRICRLVGRLEEDIFPDELRGKKFQKLKKEATYYHDSEIPLEPGFEQKALNAVNENPEEFLLRDEKLKGLKEALETLTPREECVLECRYLDEKTLEETGEILGVSVERIRQIEAKALRRLRHPTRARLIIGGLNE